MASESCSLPVPADKMDNLLLISKLLGVGASAADNDATLSTVIQMWTTCGHAVRLDARSRPVDMLPVPVNQPLFEKFRKLLRHHQLDYLEAPVALGQMIDIVLLDLSCALFYAISRKGASAHIRMTHMPLMHGISRLVGELPLQPHAEAFLRSLTPETPAPGDGLSQAHVPPHPAWGHPQQTVRHSQAAAPVASHNAQPVHVNPTSAPHVSYQHYQFHLEEQQRQHFHQSQHSGQQPHHKKAEQQSHLMRKRHHQEEVRQVQGQRMHQPQQQQREQFDAHQESFHNMHLRQPPPPPQQQQQQQFYQKNDSVSTQKQQSLADGTAIQVPEPQPPTAQKQGDRPSVRDIRPPGAQQLEHWSSPAVASTPSLSHQPNSIAGHQQTRAEFSGMSMNISSAKSQARQKQQRVTSSRARTLPTLLPKPVPTPTYQQPPAHGAQIGYNMSSAQQQRNSPAAATTLCTPPQPQTVSSTQEPLHSVSQMIVSTTPMQQQQTHVATTVPQVMPTSQLQHDGMYRLAPELSAELAYPMTVTPEQMQQLASTEIAEQQRLAHLAVAATTHTHSTSVPQIKPLAQRREHLREVASVRAGKQLSAAMPPASRQAQQNSLSAAPGQTTGTASYPQAFLSHLQAHGMKVPPELLRPGNHEAAAEMVRYLQQLYSQMVGQMLQPPQLLQILLQQLQNHRSVLSTPPTVQSHPQSHLQLQPQRQVQRKRKAADRSQGLGIELPEGTGGVWYNQPKQVWLHVDLKALGKCLVREVLGQSLAVANKRQKCGLGARASPVGPVVSGTGKPTRERSSVLGSAVPEEAANKVVSMSGLVMTPGRIDSLKQHATGKATLTWLRVAATSFGLQAASLPEYEKKIGFDAVTSAKDLIAHVQANKATADEPGAEKQLQVGVTPNMDDTRKVVSVPSAGPSARASGDTFASTKQMTPLVEKPEGGEQLAAVASTPTLGIASRDGNEKDRKTVSVAAPSQALGPVAASSSKPRDESVSQTPRIPTPPAFGTARPNCHATTAAGCKDSAGRESAGKSEIVDRPSHGTLTERLEAPLSMAAAAVAEATVEKRSSSSLGAMGGRQLANVRPAAMSPPVSGDVSNAIDCPRFPAAIESGEVAVCDNQAVNAVAASSAAPGFVNNTSIPTTGNGTPDKGRDTLVPCRGEERSALSDAPSSAEVEGAVRVRPSDSSAVNQLQGAPGSGDHRRNSCRETASVLGWLRMAAICSPELDHLEQEMGANEVAWTKSLLLSRVKHL